VLEIRDVVSAYGKVVAVKGVSLTVAAGQLVAIIGANGAGKSTLLRTIAGLRRASEGDIVFKGSSINGASPRHVLSLGIALCPEGRCVFPHLTVVENLLMGAYLRTDRGSVAEDLEHVFDDYPRLAERRRHMAGTLSGGEQQMLAISRALMSRPELVMFDEPSLGLAPNIAERTFELIRDVCQRGMTVLMVEQNAQAALAMCDWAYVLESGSLALSGAGRDLIDNPHVRSAYLGGACES
jgi:branched-chain amino acid transport system ATP-binding protein